MLNYHIEQSLLDIDSHPKIFSFQFP